MQKLDLCIYLDFSKISIFQFCGTIVSCHVLRDCCRDLYPLDILKYNTFLLSFPTNTHRGHAVLKYDINFCYNTTTIVKPCK